MLYLVTDMPKNLIDDVYSLFSELQYGAIKGYINDLIKYDAIKRIVGIPEDIQPIKTVGCETVFGYCTLDCIATSIQILILCKLAIEHNKSCCFVAGLIGDNYITEIAKICENTNLISLYCPTGILPQTYNTVTKQLQDNLYKQKYHNI